MDANCARSSFSTALALLAGCSIEPDAPTAAEASAALADAVRLTWTLNAAPERSPIRVDASGHLISLVAAGTPPLKPRSAKPPAVTVLLLALSSQKARPSLAIPPIRWRVRASACSVCGIGAAGTRPEGGAVKEGERSEQ